MSPRKRRGMTPMKQAIECFELMTAREVALTETNYFPSWCFYSGDERIQDAATIQAITTILKEVRDGRRTKTK